MAVPATNNLTIYVLNVGQADSAIIISPRGNIIIVDAVRPRKLIDLLQQAGPPINNEIEELVITHPHRDHFSGANRLLNSYQVKSATLSPFWNQYGMGPPTYRAILNNMEQGGTDIDFVSGYSRIYPDGAVVTGPDNFVHDEDAFYIEFLGPSNNLLGQLERDRKLDTNHLSILTRVHWQRFSMILAADAQMENWSYFDQEGMLREDCDVLKSAHHGSCNGTQWERLERLDPRCVIISSDPDRSHSLPDLVGTAIFSKYESDYNNKVVALTSETHSIRITVPNGNGYDIQHFDDVPDGNVDLTNPHTLTRQNNQSNWRQLLENRSRNLYL
jgi:competence protein ComEC